MSSKIKSILITLFFAIWFCFRAVVLYYATYFCESWVIDVMAGTFAGYLAILGLSILFVWADYFLFRFFYKKEMIGKWAINIIAACDVLLYLFQCTTYFAFFTFSLLVGDGIWDLLTLQIAFAFPALLRIQILFTKYLLVRKLIPNGRRTADSLQMALACIPVINWLNVFLRIFLNRRAEDRKKLLKRDAALFGGGILVGLILSAAFIFIGDIGLEYFTSDSTRVNIVYQFVSRYLPDYIFVLPLTLDQFCTSLLFFGMFLLPYGTPMLIDLFMLQRRERKTNSINSAEDNAEKQECEKENEDTEGDKGTENAEDKKTGDGSLSSSRR